MGRGSHVEYDREACAALTASRGAQHNVGRRPWSGRFTKGKIAQDVSRLDEASTAVTEEAVIQRGAPTIALAVLVGFAVNMKFALVADMIVNKNAFLAESSFEAPAQQQ
jgi:hypothetical protein